MTPTPTIIFDFGGVLLEWHPHLVYRNRFKDDRSIDRFFEEIDFYTWNLEQDRGRPFAEAVDLLSSQFPQHADLIRMYNDDWEKSIVGTIQPNVDILLGLKQAGYPLHGLSNFSTEKFGLMRARFPFFSVFETILLSAEVSLLKPDERIFHIMLDRINRRPEECIYIDDSAANIATANRLGMHTIHVSPQTDLGKELAGLGVQHG